MASYLSRVKIIADYLQDAGSEMKNEDIAYAILSGLPDSYDALTMILANLEDAKFTSNEVKKALLTLTLRAPLISGIQKVTRGYKRCL